MAVRFFSFFLISGQCDFLVNCGVLMKVLFWNLATMLLATFAVSFSESLTNFWISGSTGDSIGGTPVQHNIQTNAEEERLLKEIIDATRQVILLFVLF